MRYQVEITPQADEDLAEIVSYIAKDDPLTAEAFGMGRDPGPMRPEGATEVRQAAIELRLDGKIFLLKTALALDFGIAHFADVGPVLGVTQNVFIRNQAFFSRIQAVSHFTNAGFSMMPLGFKLIRIVNKRISAVGVIVVGVKVQDLGEDAQGLLGEGVDAPEHAALIDLAVDPVNEYPRGIGWFCDGPDRAFQNVEHRKKSAESASDTN